MESNGTGAKSRRRRGTEIPGELSGQIVSSP